MDTKRIQAFADQAGRVAGEDYYEEIKFDIIDALLAEHPEWDGDEHKAFLSEEFRSHARAAREIFIEGIKAVWE